MELMVDFVIFSLPSLRAEQKFENIQSTLALVIVNFVVLSMNLFLQGQKSKQNKVLVTVRHLVVNLYIKLIIFFSSL